MRILVLGARGTLGHDLVKAFAGDELVAWDRNDLDITDEASVSERLASVDPAVVVNAAAYTDVDAAEEQQEEADTVNGFAVGNLAVSCATLDLPLLHLSTDMVFGQEVLGGYAEDDEPLQPLNAYGRSKLLGETLLKENCRSYWLVRTAWLFGGHGENFFTKFRRAAAENSSVPVVADVVGTPTYARDLAGAIRSLIGDRAPFGVYHLVNGGTASRAEMAEALARLLNLPVTVKPVPSERLPTKARRQRVAILRNTKRPSLRPWQEAFVDYVQEARLSETTAAGPAGGTATGFFAR